MITADIFWVKIWVIKNIEEPNCPFLFKHFCNFSVQLNLKPENVVYPRPELDGSYNLPSVNLSSILSPRLKFNT